MEKIEKKLKSMLLYEWIQYELDGLAMGCSMAKHEYECIDSMLSVIDWSVDDLLDNWGYDYDVLIYGKEIEALYNELVELRIKQRNSNISL